MTRRSVLVTLLLSGIVLLGQAPATATHTIPSAGAAAISTASLAAPRW